MVKSTKAIWLSLRIVNVATFREGIEKAAGEVLCAYGTLNDVIGDAFGDAVSGIPGFGKIGNFIGQPSDYLKRLTCEVSPPTGGYPDPLPGEQGKCDGVVYKGTYTIRRSNESEFSGLIPDIYGPIEYIGLGETIPSNSYFAICRGDAKPDFGGNRPPIKPPGQVVSIASSSVTDYVEVVEQDLFRVDGQPDNCGDGPPSYQPPIEWEPPGGQPIIDNPIVVVNPIVVNVNNNFVIPLLFTFNEFSLNVEFNINTGDINILPALPSPPGGGNCCPTFDPPENDNPPEEDEPPPPNDERRFLGVFVTLSIVGEISATTIGDGNGPDIFVPRAAVISFAVEYGNSRGWTVDIAIKKKRQFVPVPEGVLGYDWAIFYEPGFEGAIAPVYANPA